MAKVQPIIKKNNRKIEAASNQLVKKNKAVEKKTKFVVPARKIEPQQKKIKSNKIVEAVPNSRTAAIGSPVKTVKSKILSANEPKIQKHIRADKKVKAAAKILKPDKAVQTIKSKTKVKSIAAPSESEARKMTPVISGRQIKPVEKNKISPVSAGKAKKTSLAFIVSNASKKSAETKKTKPTNKIASGGKAKAAEKKNKQNVIAQKSKQPTKSNESIRAVQVVKAKSRASKAKVSDVKIAGEKTGIKSAKSSEIAVARQVKAEEKQIKSAAPVKTIKLERNKVIKAKIGKIEPIVSVNETKVIPTAAEVLPVEKKLKSRKIKPIGSAVFRGRKDRYDFKVFPLDNEFEDVSAIYVISRRKIDRQKKGHHALVCIGQTDSVASEIKKHKNKCIKKHNANVISILPEADEKKRLRIEEDLRAAHAIACRIA